MHKWTVLTVLLIAVVAVSNGQRRRSRLFQMGRPMSVPFQAGLPRQYMMPAHQYGGYGHPAYNMPSYNMPMIGRRVPDGDYYGPHGTTSVDGSDISFDHHGGDYMMIG